MDETGAKPGEAGRYESNLPEYPGFIQFPYPFTLAHFRAWWELSIRPMKGKAKTETNVFVDDWPGAKELITRFGDWRIDGVSLADLQADNVPMEVVSWVTDCADDYIAPQLSQKKRLLLSIATWLEK